MTCRRGSIVQIREKCKFGIEKVDLLIAELTGNPNPQARELKAEAQGRRQILEAVMEATNGDYFNLNTFTKF